ncbi:MAG: hypothetical protein AAGM22_30350 [Acidobacteriota bacterium]
MFRRSNGLPYFGAQGVPSPRIGRAALWACVLTGGLLLSLPAAAQECWQVMGWSPVDLEGVPVPGAQANVAYADCTVIPEGTGWMQVNLTYGEPVPDDLYLRVQNTGDLIWGWLGDGWYFDGLIVYEEYDGLEPVVRYEPSLCVGCPFAEILRPWPPKQAGKSQLLGKRVRLRHAVTSECLYTEGPNNGPTLSEPCGEFSEQTFVLDHAGGGTVRLRNEDDNQCLYTQDFDNATVHHWGCWASPVQRFKLPQTSHFGGGFRLHNVERGQCIYGNNTNDPIRSWTCWDSMNQAFKIDRLE